MGAVQLKEEKLLQQREQVLEAFARLVRENGLRATSMAGLAKNLGVSTKTLYKHFPGKAVLLQAVIQEKMDEFNQRRVNLILQGENLHRRIEMQALEWLELQRKLGEQFIHEVARDFPEVYRLYQSNMNSFLARSRDTLKSEIRADLNNDYTSKLLWDAINQVPPAEQCEAFGMTRKQVLLQTIDIWARGSLKMYAA